MRHARDTNRTETKVEACLEIYKMIYIPSINQQFLSTLHRLSFHNL